MNAVWKFFTDNPIARFIAWALVALIGWEAVKRSLKDAGRKAEPIPGPFGPADPGPFSPDNLIRRPDYRPFLILCPECSLIGNLN